MSDFNHNNSNHHHHEEKEKAASSEMMSMMMQQCQDIINWTLPGLALYFRDADLPPAAIANYNPGSIIMERGFVDVSSMAGKPTKNTRFVVASSKAAPLFLVAGNPDAVRWRFHTLGTNSFFKVLDVYVQQGTSHVILLHIPFQGVEFFRRSVLRLGQENVEDKITAMARQSIDTKLASGMPNEELEEDEWIRRTAAPIGQSDTFELFPLVPVAYLSPTTFSTETPPPREHPLMESIRPLANDDQTTLNNPFPNHNNSNAP